MKINKVFIFGFVLFLLGCSPNYISWTKRDYKPNKFRKIAVFGLVADWRIREGFEDMVVAQLLNLGYGAVSGIDIIPRDQYKNLDIDQIRNRLLKYGVDAVLSLAVVEQSRHLHYQPGGAYIVPTGFARFGRYYTRTYDYIYQPGYYQQSINYITEIHFFDYKEPVEDALVWAMQKSITNPNSPSINNSNFTKSLLKTLQKDGIL